MCKKGLKKGFKKAQHLVELALFVPFIMVFVGVMTDMGYAVNSNHKFAASLYEAASTMSLLDKIDRSTKATVTDIKSYTQALAKLRGTPYYNTIDVKFVETKDISFLIGSYNYTSFFDVTNSIIEFTPNSYNFSSIIPMNSAVLRQNPYPLSNDDLNSLMAAYYATTGTPAAGEEEEEEEGEAEEEEEVTLPEVS